MSRIVKPEMPLLLIRLLATLALLALSVSAPALAQDAPPQRSPLGITLPSDAQQKVQAPQGAGHVAVGAALSDRIWAWMIAKQAQYKQAMSAAVRDLKAGNLYALALLCGLGFAYGVVHASGPGHGKAIIASYVLANERVLKRGIALSFLAALIQALSAIAFVSMLALVLKATSMTIRSAEAWTETLSWALVAAVGAWLLYRQIRLLWPAAAPLAQSPSAGATHGHHDAHDHQHGPDCGCGHSHAPDARQLDGDMSVSKALAIAFAIGIRPCTGALTLLFLTLAQGVLWAGIAATFAMALGTAITYRFSPAWRSARVNSPIVSPARTPPGVGASNAPPASPAPASSY